MSEGGVVLRLCASCREGGWAALDTALADLSVPVQVVSQDCMNGCAAPVSMALQGEGRATCFFAGVDPDADAQDIAATVAAYAAAPEGWIEDARPCGRLRFCLVGRVPAL